MPSYKGKILNNQCSIDVCITPPIATNKKKDIDLNNSVFKGIIDTGAQRTCVSTRVSDKLKLQSTGKETMNSASETKDVNVFNIDFFIPITSKIEKKSVDEKVIICQDMVLKHFPSLRVMELLSYGSYDVLIGMDVLINCTLVLSHGEFILSI